MTGLLVGAAFVALALLSVRYGVDTRDSSDWRVRRDRTEQAMPGARHRIGSDLRGLVGLLRRAGGFLARRWDAQERAWGACWRAHQPWRGDDLPEPRVEVPGSRVPGQRNRASDELHWRAEDGQWRLTGRVLPSAPPTDRPSSEPSARNN